MWESGPLGLPNIGLVLLCQKSFEHQISTHITHGPAFPRTKAHSSMHTHCKSGGFNFQRYFESWKWNWWDLLSSQIGWEINSHSHQWNWRTSCSSCLSEDYWHPKFSLQSSEGKVQLWDWLNQPGFELMTLIQVTLQDTLSVTFLLRLYLSMQLPICRVYE